MADFAIWVGIKMDADTIKSFMTLAGGVLTFSAVVLAIVNSQLQKAKTASSRERVVRTTLNVAGVLFALAGLITIIAGAGVNVVAICLFSISCIIASIDYLRHSETPSRLETFVLIFMICVVFFLINLYFFTHFFGRILDLMEKEINVLKTLSNR